jgi:hypothetical protein
MGAMRDLAQAGLTVGFLEQVSRELRPGGAAAIADVEEAQPVALDALTVAQGGRLFRHRLDRDTTERRLMHDIRMLQQELALIGKQQHGLCLAESTSSLQRSRAVELASAVRLASSLAAALRQEAGAKARLLARQAGLFEGDARHALECRAAVIQTGLEERAERLARAARVSATPTSAPKASRKKRPS